MTGVEATKFTFMFHLLSRAGKADIDSNHGHQETSSKIHYILPGRCQLDEEDEVGIESLIAEIQPEIPLLVVRMLKSNVNGPQASLVTCHLPIVQLARIHLLYHRKSNFDNVKLCCYIFYKHEFSCAFVYM